ncbi:MAG: TetR/AcrR family transcriptional regulator [Anaerolineae bacterium]|nr:TetR/AcrR family transcriptional regulator [Anaerolineae bacterium]
METSNEVKMRPQILNIAAQMFAERGYDGVSIREISAACGLSKAALYYHFEDKQALFMAILQEHLEELSNLLDEAEALPGNARRRLSALMRAILVRIPPDRRAIIRLATQDIAKVQPEVRRQFQQQYEARFIRRIESLIQSGIENSEFRNIPPALGTWAFLGIMYPFFTRPLAEQQNDAEHILCLLESLFFEGLDRKP